MSEFSDGRLSTLARKLEPYVRKWVREILGENDGKSVGNITWIQGTGFPKLDESVMKRGRWNIGTADNPFTTWGFCALQLNRENDDEITQGESQWIMGGADNKMYWRADDVAGGRGGYATGDLAWCMGNKFSVPGDGQTLWIVTFGEEDYYPHDPWVPLYDYDFEDTPPCTLLLNSYFVGHNCIDGSKQWHFSLDAVFTWNPLSIIWQKSTEHYSSGDGVDVRIGSEYGLTFQARSDCQQGIRWFVSTRIAQVGFP